MIDRVMVGYEPSFHPDSPGSNCTQGNIPDKNLLLYALRDLELKAVL